MRLSTISTRFGKTSTRNPASSSKADISPQQARPSSFDEHRPFPRAAPCPWDKRTLSQLFGHANGSVSTKTSSNVTRKIATESHPYVQDSPADKSKALGVRFSDEVQNRYLPPRIWERVVEENKKVRFYNKAGDVVEKTTGEENRKIKAHTLFMPQGNAATQLLDPTFIYTDPKDNRDYCYIIDLSHTEAMYSDPRNNPAPKPIKGALKKRIDTDDSTTE